VRHGTFVFTAIVVAGCLVVGVSLAFVENVPAALISIVLAIAVATLIHAFLGGVSEAGFNLGALRVTGSAAVLLGSAWLFNSLLAPQLAEMRAERLERYSFRFDQHATPAAGWFAVSNTSGIPVDVKFTDPVTDKVVETVMGRSGSLRLRLAYDELRRRYVVLGVDAEMEESLGYVEVRDAIGAVGSGGLRPGTVYGVERLYLTQDGELPPGKERRWGNTECRGRSMPFQIEVVEFRGYADYDLRRCGAASNAGPDHSSSLSSGQGEFVPLTIQDQHRIFMIAVVGADHQSNPPWSAFLAIEIVADG